MMSPRIHKSLDSRRRRPRTHTFMAAVRLALMELAQATESEPITDSEQAEPTEAGLLELTEAGRRAPTEVGQQAVQAPARTWRPVVRQAVISIFQNFPAHKKAADRIVFIAAKT